MKGAAIHSTKNFLSQAKENDWTYARKESDYVSLIATPVLITYVALKW